MEPIQFKFMGAENHEVFGYYWKTNKSCIGNIVISHGMCEYALRYQAFADFLNMQGFDVFCVDHIGHGINAYEGRGVWKKNSFQDCVHTIHILICSLLTTGKPIYLIGHSMGSFIAQSYLFSYPTHPLKKVILIGSSGPQLIFKAARTLTKLHCFGKKGEKPSPFLKRVSFGSFNRKIKNKKSKNAWICSNEEVVEAYDLDENCTFVPSRNFFYSFYHALADLHKKEKLQRLHHSLSIQILGGKEDPLSQYGKTLKKLQSIYAAQGISTEMHLYDEMRHEILNETKKEVVFQDILHFLTQF